jgi:hypothetical protein
MGLIFPVAEGTPDDKDAAFEDFAADWSDTWMVEVDTDFEDDEAGDVVRLGPLSAQAAWELASALDAKRPDWTMVVLPLFSDTDVDSIIEQIEA